MSRMSGRKAFDLEWVERWARQVNEDRRLPVIGRFFSGRFVLGIDDTDYLIEVNKGKVQKIAEGLAPNDFGFEFALRASSVTWTTPAPKPKHKAMWRRFLAGVCICPRSIHPMAPDAQALNERPSMRPCKARRQI